MYLYFRYLYVIIYLGIYIFRYLYGIIYLGMYILVLIHIYIYIYICLLGAGQPPIGTDCSSSLNNACV